MLGKDITCNIQEVVMVNIFSIKWRFLESGNVGICQTLCRFIVKTNHIVHFSSCTGYLIVKTVRPMQHQVKSSHVVSHYCHFSRIHLIRYVLKPNNVPAEDDAESQQITGLQHKRLNRAA